MYSSSKDGKAIFQHIFKVLRHSPRAGRIHSGSISSLSAANVPRSNFRKKRMRKRYLFVFTSSVYVTVLTLLLLQNYSKNIYLKLYLGSNSNLLSNVCWLVMLFMLLALPTLTNSREFWQNWPLLLKGTPNGRTIFPICSSFGILPATWTRKR